jgi:rhodanese-related sulfurtransferase
MATAATHAPTFSLLLETPAADAEAARRHFAAKLSLETDPSDVYVDQQKGVPGFVVVDTRRPESFARAHVPGAINIPYRTISEATTASIPKDTLVVTYCAGPACNASTKGALRFAQLGYRVKEMIGGIEGWAEEGYPVASGPE